MSVRTMRTPARLATLFLMVLGLTLAGCGGGSVAGLTVGDLDGDGILDDRDNDLDGDGLLNQFDPDVDNDGIPNEGDPDSDNDGIRNDQDTTPLGPWIPASQTLFVSGGVATVSFGDVPEGQLAGPATITIQNDTINPVTVQRVALVGTGAGAYAIDTSSLPGATFALPPGGGQTFTATYTARNGTPSLGRIEVDFSIGGPTFAGVVHLLGQGASPALTASGAPSTINFGDVPIGVTAGPGIATLRNDTSSAISITDVQLTGTGGGTFAVDITPLGGPLPFSVAAGATARFHVRYTPLQGLPNVGEVQVDLDLGTSTRSLALDLLGQGIAPSISIADEVDFGVALEGVEALDMQLEVRNESFATGPLEVTAVTLSDDALGDFVIQSDPTPFQIAPGGAPVVIGLRFRPGGGRLGERVGALTLTANLPAVSVERTVTLRGRSAGWQQPDVAPPTDLTGAAEPAPTSLAGSSLFVVRSAGPDGVWGGIVSPDDELVVVDANADGDDATADGRVVVRWGGLRLSPTAACAPIDAGNGRHVFFLSPGLDSALGTADDQINVLDTVSGVLRSLACPDVGAHKSLPVLVDASTGLVVVATGTGGGVVPSADTLLIYENLLGNLSATAADQTIALGAIVPDVAACIPTRINNTTVVMPVADSSGSPDLSDRALDDGNEGVVQVRDLLAGAQVEVLDLARALAETAAPEAGDGFCRPVRVSDSSALVMTAGADATLTTDDDVVRLDALGTDTPLIGPALAVSHASGVASRPVFVAGSRFAFVGPGVDGVYGTADDAMTALDASGTLSAAAFGPGEALAGDGGAASVLLASAGGVLAATAGANGTLGDADDHVLQIDIDSAGAGSILGTLPVPGGLFAGTRTASTSMAGPTRIDARFVGVLDRGPDAVEGTNDDVLRVFRDKDGDGVFGTASDDLDADGVYGATDTVQIASGQSSATSTAFAASADAHLFTLQPGVDGLSGGGDDRPLVLWLRESALLP